MRTTAFCCWTLVLAAAPLMAQQPAAPPAAPAAAPAPPPPVADSADVKTIDGIMRAVYDVISGDAGQARNWDRFRSLFAQGARLIPTGQRQNGSFGIRMLTPDDYARLAGPNLERDGFHEVEIARRTETYGPVVHLFSTYESRRARTDAQPFARGINSFQLMNDGARWYVVNIFWFNENQAFPIPARYLTTENH